MVGDPSRSTVVSEVGGLGLRLTGPEGGQLLVALPGLGRGAADFDPLARRLADAGWRTAALDPRGVGTSRGPGSAASLDDHAGDVARVVEALGAAPAWIVGHTFGSRVAELAEYFNTHDNITVDVVNDPRCIELMERLKREKPDIWAEDIGE